MVRPPAHVRALSRGVYLAEQAWRPRPCGYAHRRSGSPWVPVRPENEGLPSKEGRYGSDEGRRKPPGSRGMKVPRFGPDEHGPGVEDATSGAPGGGVPRKGDYTSPG